MCYEDGRGVVPPAGIRPIQMPRIGKRCKKTSFFFTVLKNLNKRGKIRPFFTPFCSLFGYGIFFVVRWCSTAELCLMPIEYD